ncbi:MAG: CHASE2 domain-containing protein [Candidatus Omnitrophota bacterium]
MDAKLNKKFRMSISIGLLSALLIATFFFFLPQLYAVFEAKTLDLRFQLRGPIVQDKHILFLEMDEAAIKDLGRWPWPRDIFARIVETLKRLDCRAVLFDVTFSNPTQLIVDREKLYSQLKLEENKKLLKDFITDTKQLLYQKVLNPADVGNALLQLEQGIDVWDKNIQDTLSAATQDNDLLFSRIIKQAGNVYLGYHFEVIHTPGDIKKDVCYQLFKQTLTKWVEEHPAQNFPQLPFSLKRTAGLTPKEIQTAFTRVKLYYLFSRNLELTLDNAALSLGLNDPVELRPHYNAVRTEVFRDKIIQIRAAAKDAALKEIVWKLGLFNPEDIELVKQEYNRVVLEDVFSQKVGIPYPREKGFLKAVNLTPPILSFVQSMKSAGFLNAITDTDGTLRKAPLLVYYKDRIYPHIALRILFDLWGVDPQKDIRIDPGKSITAGSHRIPLDTRGFLLLNWPGKWQDSFQHLSASQVYRFWELEQNVRNNLRLSDEELQENNLRQILIEDQKKLQELSRNLSVSIKDKICIIGLTAPGTHDYTPIPLESDYPAVGTHAAILNTILNEKFLQRIDGKWTIGIIFILSVTIALCVSAMSAGYSLVFILFVSILYCIVSFVFFVKQGLCIDIVGPLGGMLLSYVLVVSYSFATEEKEKRWVKKAFGHYISKNVMEEILKNPAKLKLGGERRELSVLFSDIRNFTSYSEKRQPEEVVDILNEYFEEMSKIILKHNGTLDKYVGDEIMAIFGAPSAAIETGHAKKAVCVAIEMIERLVQLQEKWRAEAKEPVDIGIGINTGIMLVGNMGTMERMDYTVIGDAVNLAARIETLTRTYNNHIMISEFTYAHVKDIIEVKPLEAIRVKGKQEPVMMYEVLGYKKGGGKDAQG